MPERPLFGAPRGGTDRDRELRLERDGFDAAIGRYRAALEGAAHNQLRASTVARHFAALSVAVGTEQAALCRPNARLPKYGPALLAVDAARAAVVTLHTLLGHMGVAADAAGAEVHLTAVARAVGHTCYQLWMQDQLVPGRRRDVAQLLAAKYRGGRAQALARRRAAGLNRPWSHGYRDIHLGVFLIALAAGSTGAVEVVKQSRRDGPRVRAVNVVRLTDAARAEVAADLSRAEGRILPVRRPMVCPPVPWTDLQGGGYLTDADLDCGLPLVTHHNRPARVAALTAAARSGQMGRVLRVVNALQATLWRVNAEPHGWMTRIVDGAVDDSDPLRSPAAARLAECADLAAEPRLFFPYKLDYRGRAYCVPESFQPQGDDAARALLEFAVGRPLGDRGASCCPSTWPTCTAARPAAARWTSGRRGRRRTRPTSWPPPPTRSAAAPGGRPRSRGPSCGPAWSRPPTADTASATSRTCPCRSTARATAPSIWPPWPATSGPGGT